MKHPLLIIPAYLIVLSLLYYGSHHFSLLSYKNFLSDTVNYGHNISKTTAYQVAYFNQLVDHSDPKSQTWSQKILIDNSSWLGPQKKGPILFLTGCEEDIVTIYSGNGYFNTVIIPQLGAYAIYAEHRYFGDSMPFGNKSFERANVRFLSVEQTLEDYAAIIQHYKTEVLNCPECSVVTYGASYCGELASWMRMKHPEIVDAAVASSAPIRYFDKVIDPEAYYARSTQVYNESSAPGCAEVIREGFKRITKYTAENSNYKELNSYMNFCVPMTSGSQVPTLSSWMRNSFIWGSMLNYVRPYDPDAGKYIVDIATRNFINLTMSSSDQAIFMAMRNAAMISTEKDPKDCLDIFGTKFDESNSTSSAAVAPNPFLILNCNDLPESVGNNAVDDMYYPAISWSKSALTGYCAVTYGLYPKFDWVLDTFGGRQLSDYSKYSNIFFANNNKDPWFVGGVVQNVTDSVVAYTVEDGCHGQDLFFPSIYDSDSLKFVRQKELEYLQKWISEKHNRIQHITV